MEQREFNSYRRRKWVWFVAVMDCIIAVLVCGRFFHYVANDARIKNTPPMSELEDRISLLWTWFAFLAAYVCQLLMAIGLIIGTNKKDVDTVLGNCQLWIYGAHCLNVYTVVELIILIYLSLKSNTFEGNRIVLITVIALAKLAFRVTSFFVVKIFMKDLCRPSCTCHHLDPSPGYHGPSPIQHAHLQQPMAHHHHHPQSSAIPNANYRFPQQ